MYNAISDLKMSKIIFIDKKIYTSVHHYSVSVALSVTARKIGNMKITPPPPKKKKHKKELFNLFVQYSHLWHCIFEISYFLKIRFLATRVYKSGSDQLLTATFMFIYLAGKIEHGIRTPQNFIIWYTLLCFPTFIAKN